jgi:hypothetical protein
MIHASEYTMAAKACKFGKVKSGPRKGSCRMRKLSGAARKAGKCRGNKGSSFKACVSSAFAGMRRRRSR